MISSLSIQKLLLHAEEAILLMDARHRVTEASGAAEKLTGVPEHLLRDYTLTNLFVPEDRQTVLDNLARAAEHAGTVAETGPLQISNNTTGKKTWLNMLAVCEAENSCTVLLRKARLPEQETVEIEKQQLVELQQTGQFGIWNVDLKTGKVWWSDELRKLAGLAANGLTETGSEKDYDFVHEADREKVKKVTDEAIKNGSDYSVSFRMKTADGRLKHCVTFGSALHDEQGRPVRLFGITQDAELILSLQKELHISQQRLNRFMEYIPGGAFIFDEHNNLLHINDWYSELLFEEAEEAVTGKNYEKYLKSDLLRDIRQQNAEVLNNQKVIYYENCYQRTSGPHWYYTVKFPVSEPGSTTKIGGVTLDITSLKMSEQARNENERLLQQAQEIARLGFYEYDLKTLKARWSDEMFNITGTRKGAFEPREDTLVPMVHPEDREKIVEQFNRALTSPGKKKWGDWRLLRKDGKMRYVTGTIRVIYDKAGQPVKVLGVLMDITSRKEAEQKIARQNQELRRLNRELDNFIYSSSHDLRAPLTSARGLLQLMKNSADQENFDHYLQLMEQMLFRLDKLTQEILDLFSNYRSEVKQEPVRLDEMVNDILSELQFMEGAEKIEKIVDFKQQTALVTDRQRVNIILSNLLSNAITYHNLYQEAPRIVVRGEITDEKAIVTIEDNGQGIPEYHLSRIFEMFYRANPSKKGSGLGLYLVKEAITKISGKIEVHSEYGTGTVFTLELPRLHHKNGKTVAGAFS